MKIKIKTSNEAAFELDIDQTSDVSLLKQQIQSHFNDEDTATYRLIYAGKVLKDEQSIEETKLKEGNTVHLVRGQKAAAPSSTATVSTPAQNTATLAAIPQQPAFNMFGNNNAFGMGPTGMGAGMPGMGGLDPQMVTNIN